jgi:PmbA protein
MDKAIELLNGRCDAYEVFGQQSETASISFEAGMLKVASVKQSSGTGCRVFVGGRTGLSSTNQPDRAADMIDAALASAAFGEKLPIELPGPAAGPDVGGFDDAVAGLPVETLIDRGRRLVAALREICPEANHDVHLSRSVSRFDFVNSSGQRFTSRHSGYAVSASLERFRDDDILSVYESDYSTRDDIDETALIASVRQRFADARQVVKIAPGRHPVIFAPRSVIALLLPVQVALSGKSVAQGVSALAGKTGERICSDRLTVTDDATLPNRASSGSHDDEGVPTRPLTLIEKGVLNAYYTDLHSAARLGTSSTGHASRGLGSPPSPATSNVLLAPGEVPLAEMIGSIDCGLLIDMVLGIGQGNPLSGDFSNTLGLAFKIEKGRLTGRVKNTSIAGNVYQDLQHVAALEDQAHWIQGSLHLPHVLLDGLAITAK